MATFSKTCRCCTCQYVISTRDPMNSTSYQSYTLCALQTAKHSNQLVYISSPRWSVDVIIFNSITYRNTNSLLFLTVRDKLIRKAYNKRPRLNTVWHYRSCSTPLIIYYNQILIYYSDTISLRSWHLK